ncbi:MAG: trypsin-like peptidase domain-containing protein [Clostridia bacterium]|nr:trypsin-like peptidase domain-containing protein [Clostridia bacterium]
MEKERIKMPTGAIVACVLITLFRLACAAGIAYLIFSSYQFGRSSSETPTVTEAPSAMTTDQPADQPAEPTAAPAGETDKPSSGLDISGTQAKPGDDAADIIENCMRTVVSIDITVSAYGEQVAGSGSGVIITEDGYIATCNHVVEGASSISVYLNDGSEYPAELIGNDSVTDIAVIKIEGAGRSFPYATMGSSEALRVGNDVYAIGNALGELSNTVTDGIISGIGRDIEIDGQSMTLLQTSAAINSGNSGGSLFLSYGTLIGIVNAKQSGETSSGASIEGLGFAVPIDLAKPINADIMDYGFVTGRPYLGVSTKNVSYGFSMFSYNTVPQVVSIIENSPAAKAGILENDIITAVNGETVNSSTALRVAINKYAIGEKITVTVQRGNSTYNLEVTLEERTSKF